MMSKLPYLPVDALQRVPLEHHHDLTARDLGLLDQLGHVVRGSAVPEQREHLQRWGSVGFLMDF